MLILLLLLIAVTVSHRLLLLVTVTVSPLLLGDMEGHGCLALTLTLAFARGFTLSGESGWRRVHVIVKP